MDDVRVPVLTPRPPVTPFGQPPRAVAPHIPSGELRELPARELSVREPSLRLRAPAYAVMRECLRQQAEAPPRSRLDRILGRDPVHPDARSWYRGTVGELEVARILARLDSRWKVLHAVPVGTGGADIDHVLIGPSGVFTINTKNHSGKKIWASGGGFLVNGQKLAHIRHSVFEGQRASKLLTAVSGLPVAVVPLIVVVEPQSIVREKPDVVVLAASDLALWLRRQPEMQTDDAVDRILRAAERRDTWSPIAVEHVDAACHEQRFARLRAEVDAAYSRRRAWSLLGAGSFLAAVVACSWALSPVLMHVVMELVGAR